MTIWVRLQKIWRDKEERQVMEFPNIIVNPATQRVVVTAAGNAELTNIPTEVLALRNIRKTLQRIAAATELASKGYTIDIWQDGYDIVPYELLQERRKANYPWVVALLKHAVTTVGPGITFPGDIPYDAANPPLGAILIPPLGHALGDPGVVLPEPEPEPEPEPVSPIGPSAGGSRYLFNPLSNDETPDGGIYTESGVSYLKVMRTGFAGILTKWWEKQS